MVSGILVHVLGVSVSAAEEVRDKTARPQRYEALGREFREAVHEYDVEATTDADRVEPMARIIKLSPRCLGHCAALSASCA
jgi:chloramphenicol 3-O-phosphotransferase